MGAEKDIIVAVELGSTSIRAIAGRKQLDGTMQVLTFAEERSSNTIRKGVIENIDKTTQAISNVVRQLGDKLDVHITRIYVGLAGQSMHTKRNVIPRLFPEKTKITDEIVDELRDTNQAVDYGDLKILEVVPQEYRIGTRVVSSDLVGRQADALEAVFLNVVARRELYDNIETCVAGAGLELADVLISPLCLADSQLSSSERRSGCALVDIGADTTTVSVFKNDAMCHLAVIPIGSANVTADIASIGISPEEAEVLKIKHGTAFFDENTSDATRSIPVSFDREINESELKGYTSARYEEIICNIGEQLKGRDDLICGVVVTGGGSLASDIEQAFKEYIKVDKVHLRKGLPINVELASGVTLPELSTMHTLIALLQKGDQNCACEKAEGESEEEASPAVDTPAPEADTTVDPQPAQETPATEDEDGSNEAETADAEQEKAPKQSLIDKMWEVIKKMLTDEE